MSGWLRQTNLWRKVTSPARVAKRLRSGTANGQRHDAPGSQIDRATSRAHPAQGALWRLSREIPRWKRDDGLLHGQSRGCRQYCACEGPQARTITVLKTLIIATVLLPMLAFAQQSQQPP